MSTVAPSIRQSFRVCAVAALMLSVSGCGIGPGDDLRCVSPDSQVTAKDGTVSVPVITYGTSVDDALELLSEAGLEGCTPRVDYPHYATGTDPAAGSMVSLGSRVTLEIGDG